MIDYIEDKSVLNIKHIRVDLGTITANEETDIKKEETEVRTEEELIAMVKQSRATGARGRSSSNVPDHSSKVCWRCGKKGDTSAKCRTTNGPPRALNGGKGWRKSSGKMVIREVESTTRLKQPGRMGRVVRGEWRRGRDVHAHECPVAK